jgi:NAD-dependent DNA ligase
MTDLVFTGPCPEFSRAQLMERANALGMKVRSSFCSKTLLVVGPKEMLAEGKSAKARKARELGVRTMSYEEFLDRSDSMLYGRKH